MSDWPEKAKWDRKGPKGPRWRERSDGCWEWLYSTNRKGSGPSAKSMLKPDRDLYEALERIEGNDD